MTIVALVLAGLSAILLLWSYVVYPALIRKLAKKRGSAGPAGPEFTGPIEILVSAADEERVIAARVENLLDQESQGPATITIGCDGCGDATADRARGAGGPRVRVREFPARRGKAAVLNDLIGESRAEVIVFTDANSEFDRGAVDRLVAPFADAGIDATCGRLQLRSAATGRTPETEFWDREMALKEAEGALGVCLGGNGAIYAARRTRIAPLPPDTAMDDFLIPARIARAGGKVVFAGDAVARESAPETVRHETSRRFRLGVGAGAVLRTETWLFDYRRHPLLTLAFVSRKVARWLAPVAFLAAALAALASEPLRPFGVAALLVGTLLVVSARGGLEPRGPAGRLYYFCVINLALAAGIVLGFFGYRRPAWKPTSR